MGNLDPRSHAQTNLPLDLRHRRRHALHHHRTLLRRRSPDHHAQSRLAVDRLRLAVVDCGSVGHRRRSLGCHLFAGWAGEDAHGRGVCVLESRAVVAVLDRRDRQLLCFGAEE